ncbi:hypothetical protein KCP77_07905 [Salmonella enterica subsp. enterica]|nr:hypothetical protein KCP77_07905 [Salmonella enterica subsp. enterica]
MNIDHLKVIRSLFLNSDTSLIRSLHRNFTHHYDKAKTRIGRVGWRWQNPQQKSLLFPPRCWLGFGSFAWRG